MSHAPPLEGLCVVRLRKQRCLVFGILYIGYWIHLGIKIFNEFKVLGILGYWLEITMLLENVILNCRFLRRSATIYQSVYDVDKKQQPPKVIPQLSKVIPRPVAVPHFSEKIVPTFHRIGDAVHDIHHEALTVRIHFSERFVPTFLWHRRCCAWRLSWRDWVGSAKGWVVRLIYLFFTLS